MGRLISSTEHFPSLLLIFCTRDSCAGLSIRYKFWGVEFNIPKIQFSGCLCPNLVSHQLARRHRGLLHFGRDRRCFSFKFPRQQSQKTLFSSDALLAGPLSTFFTFNFLPMKNNFVSQGKKRGGWPVRDVWFTLSSSRTLRHFSRPTPLPPPSPVSSTLPFPAAFCCCSLGRCEFVNFAAHFVCCSF